MKQMHCEDNASHWIPFFNEGYDYEFKYVIALKDVRDVSPISSLILGLGWALWSTTPRLKETLIAF